MARAWMKLEGFDQYFETLQKASRDIDMVAEQCLDAGSDVLIAGMLRRAPDSKRVKAVIRKTAIMADGSKRYMYLGIPCGQDAEAVRLANVFEFGGRAASNPKYPKRKPRPGFVAHPFVRPTLRNDAKKARAAIEKIFQFWVNG